MAVSVIANAGGTGKGEGEKTLEGENAMNRQTGKLIARVSENLPDMSNELAQYWIENPKKLQNRLSAVLSCPFDVFETIKLGTGLKTADDFRVALKKNGCLGSQWTTDLLIQPAFKIASEETELKLVEVSTVELGFKRGAKRARIYQRAQELGLGLCPSEAGPQLCLQSAEKLKGECFLVATDPIVGSDNKLYLFNVVRGWLHGHDDGAPNSFWSAGIKWLFASGK